MAVPKTTLWELDAHTVAKHEILRRYLGAWFPIIGSTNRRIVYLDGFCGPGRYTGGEPGSPLIALEQALNHKDRLANTQVLFIFMDQRQDRIDHLTQELSELPLPANFEIWAMNGEFDSELRTILDRLDHAQLKLDPPFAFIDPFGYKGVPFALVQRLLANQKTEVLVNVMVDAINTHLSHPDPVHKQHVIELFGTQEVLQVLDRSTDRIRDLLALYQRQLAKAAKFVRYFEMRNCDARTIYDLFFAGNHALGHTRIKEAFWKVDPTSGYCFSDATNPSQLVLFEHDPVPELIQDLDRRFEGTTTNDANLKRYVQERTPFIDRHATAALKDLEDNGVIEWTEATWNPLTGCTKISPGCKHCYAERMALRLQAMGQLNYRNGFRLTIHEHALELPLQWKKPQMVFVNSMSDLFHKDVPTEFILRVFDVMRQASWHRFQVLTKRSARLAELDHEIAWPSNVWMGVSVENGDYVSRIDDLRSTSACVKFLSLEPLLGPLPQMNLSGLHWVIVGGESGPGARPVDRAWVEDIRDQCADAAVAFFFKQWGGVNKKRAGRTLDGRTWDEMPRLAELGCESNAPLLTMSAGVRHC